MEYVIVWVAAIIIALIYWLNTVAGTNDRRMATRYLLAAILGPIVLAFIVVGWLAED